MAAKITYQVWWCTHGGGANVSTYYIKQSQLFEGDSIKECIDWITNYIDFPPMEKKTGGIFNGYCYAAVIYKLVDKVIESTPKHVRVRSSIWPPQA